MGEVFKINKVKCNEHGYSLLEGCSLTVTGPLSEQQIAYVSRETLQVDKILHC